MSPHHGKAAKSKAREEQDSIASYIPRYMKRYVFPLQNDFCRSPLYCPELLVQLMVEGFLPIATPGALLPKLHRQRCVIPLQPSSSGGDEGLHIHKSTKKKAKRFYLSLNRDFERVVDGCHNQHASCWLYPELVDSFRILHDRTTRGVSFHAKLVQEGKTCPVSFYSTEVWNDQGHLVAGELGYAVGTIYTSLTGFSSQNSAGTVQLAALGSLLVHHGFTMWDLGMGMDYKHDMGAILMERPDFVAHVHAARMSKGPLTLPVLQEPRNCKAIIAEQQQCSTHNSLGSPRPSHPAPFDDDLLSVKTKKPRGLQCENTPEDNVDGRPKLARVSP